MPDRPKRIDQHAFSPQDQLFFDANVWVFLFPPLYRSPDNRAGLYSAAFRRVQEIGCLICIDVLVLSEFVNVLARWAHRSLAPVRFSSNFKAYRNSSAFRPVAQNIADSCRRILEVSSPIESGFTDCDLPAVINDFTVGRCDFNDQVLTSLCHRRGFILVTHDGDFRGKNIPILTANPRLLR